MGFNSEFKGLKVPVMSSGSKVADSYGKSPTGNQSHQAEHQITTANVL